jgi:mitochondrial fission protein ELM1
LAWQAGPVIDGAAGAGDNGRMNPAATWVLTEAYAGLRAQALGLTEAAGLAAEARVIAPRGVWRHVPARFWPRPLSAIAAEALRPPLPDLVVGCGGKAAAVVAALRHRPRRVIVQHPRMNPRRFDLIVAARHDELSGPNVFVTRTALHRASPVRLAEAALGWRDRLAQLPRPLVAVLVGGSNGRFRLDRPVGQALANQLAAMMRADRVGVILTPSRRTDPAVTSALRATLAPLGGTVWDGTDENPYFGMLALADAIVVTTDSVSMVSEAVATAAPVLLANLPGRSRRNALFLRGLIDEGRVRPYQGRLELWPVTRLDDTAAAAAELRRRFGY